jgi:hypothetical protein
MKINNVKIHTKMAQFKKINNRFLIFIFLITPIFFVVSCSTGVNFKITKKKFDPLVTGSVKDGKYINNYYKCSFNVPEGWQYFFPEKEEEYFVYFYNTDKSFEINFKVVKLYKKTTLSEFVESENTLHKELTQIREKSIKIQSITATDTEYIKTVQTENVKLKKIYFIKGYYGFVFAFTSTPILFDAGSAKLYAMTESFRFLTDTAKKEETIEPVKISTSEKEGIQIEKEENKEKIPEDSEYIIHVVKQGDTLLSIAEYYTLDKSKHIQIAEFNNLSYPYQISINDEIKIPKILIKKMPQKKTTKTDKKPKEKKAEKEEEKEPIYGPQ